ncbi:MAG: TetR/AcrR family transcriptional regulator C-terminal domain-containing protein, partial [Cellulomonadaceae bacterium]
SVYTYVPGKPELLDLMVDTLYARATRPMWTTRSWRERIIAVAESNRALITAHPWLTEAALPSRPPLGPGVMAKYEHELAALDNTGLADVDVDAALGFVLGFVQAHCRWATDARSARAESQQSDAQWWAANAPLLARVLDPSRYPRAVRIGEAAGARQDSAWSDDHAWQFGLDRTLDGLAALIDRAG